MSSKNKSELLEELKEVFKEKGWWEDYRHTGPKVFNPDFLEALSYCNEEQIESILKNLEDNSELFQNSMQAYSEWKSLGYLKPSVCLVHGEVPSIVLGFEKYLHWYKGYYFQISRTRDGVGCICAGDMQVDSILSCCDDLHHFEENEAEAQARRDIFTACLIPVLCYYDIGVGLLKSQRNLINEFLAESCLEYNGYVKNPSLDDFDRLYSEMILEDEPDIKSLVNDAFHDHIQLINDGQCFGELVISYNSIMFIRKCSDVYIVSNFNIPKWLHLNYNGEYIVKSRERIMYAFVSAFLSRNGWRCIASSFYPYGTKKMTVSPLTSYALRACVSWMQLREMIDFRFKKLNVEEPFDTNIPEAVVLEQVKEWSKKRKKNQTPFMQAAIKTRLNDIYKW